MRTVEDNVGVADVRLIDITTNLNPNVLNLILGHALPPDWLRL